MLGLGLGLPLSAGLLRGAGAVLPTVISAAQRADMNNGVATANGATNVYTYRYFDRATKAARNIRGEFWNGWVSTSTGEQGTGNPLILRAAFISGLAYASAGVPAHDQSPATLTPCTWVLAASGASDFLFKANGAPATAAEFASAGGALSGDNRTITVPDKWRVVCDPSGVNLADGEGYCVKTEIDTSVNKNLPTGALQCQSRFNDKRVLNTAGKVYDKVDPSASSLTGVGAGFVAIWGDSPAGVKNVTNGGDSIGYGNQHSAQGSTVIVGDADGVIGAYRGALKRAGIPFNSTAVSGDKASVWYSSGNYQHRVSLCRYSKGGLFTEMGHNDRGLVFNGALPNGWLALYRWYWNLHRAAMPSGAKVIASELWPQASASPASTDGFATTANMSSAVGPGSVQYVSINPMMAGGSFNVALGDPDGAVLANQLVYQWAESVGGLDIDSLHVKPVCNGQSAPSSLWSDTTHAKGVVFEGVAALMAQTLRAKFGV